MLSAPENLITGSVERGTGVSDGAVRGARPQGGGSNSGIELQVRLSNGANVDWICGPDSTVADLKGYLHETEGVATTESRVVFGGRILKDTDVLTAIPGIGNRCVITVVVTAA